MTTHGTFYWNELITTDPAAGAAFLSDLVGGYEIREMPIRSWATPWPTTCAPA